MHCSLAARLICGNDYLALGAISYLRSVGWSIPDDISVMGFNNSAFSNFIRPSLTTVHFPSTDIGMLAAQTLVDVLVNETNMPTAQILPTPLIIRNSTSQRRET